MGAVILDKMTHCNRNHQADRLECVKSFAFHFDHFASPCMGIERAIARRKQLNLL